MYVYRPFSARTSNMLLRAKLGVAAACLLGLSGAAMFYVPLTIGIRRSKTGEWYFRWISNGLVNDFDSYRKFYFIVFEIALKFVVPSLIVVPLTVLTIFLLLHHGRRNFKQGTVTGHANNAITHTLVGIVVAFISLRGPYMIMWARYVSPTFTFTPWFVTMYYISSSLMLLNPTCNFIIYFITGSAFRRNMRRLLVCRSDRHSTELRPTWRAGIVSWSSG